MTLQVAELRADVQVAGAPKAVGELDAVDASVRRVGRSGATTVAQNRSLGQSFGGLGEQVKGAAEGFAAFEGIKFLKDVVGDAEKTNQEIETTISLFGDAGNEVVDWSEKTASSMGLSKQASLGMVDTFGVMLKGFGLTGEAAKSMGEELVKRSVDVAAFKGNGTQAADVLAGFQKGLTGASRGLKVYGVDTSAAAQKSVALKLGIDGTAASWTAAQKAAVFYQLILQGTAQATGTFASRSGDLAEQEKIMTARWADMKDEIGGALLPTVTSLFSTLTSGFSAVGPEGTALIGKLTGIGLAGTAAAAGVEALGKGVVAVKTALSASSVAAAASAAAQAEEGAAAVAAAEALTVKAQAAVAAATVDGAVDLSAIGAANALLAEAEAATVDAAALATAEVASVGLLASMGPIGIAAAVVGVAVAGLTAVTTLFGDKSNEATKSVRDLIGAMFDEGDTASGAADQLIEKYLKAHTDAGPVLRQAGIGLDEVRQALLGNSTAYADVKSKMEAWGKTDTTLTNNGPGVLAFINQKGSALRDSAKAYAQSTEGAHELAQADQDAAGKADVLRAAEQELTRQLTTNLDTLRGQQESYIGIQQSVIGLQNAQVDAATKWAIVNKLAKEGKTHTADYAQALRDAQSATNTVKLDQLGLVDASEKLAQQESAVVDAEKALDSARTDAKTTPAQLAVATKHLYDAQQNEKKSLLDLAKTLPVGSAARTMVLQLAGAIKTIPVVKTTTYVTPGLTESTLRTHNFRGELDKIGPSRKVTISVEDAAALHSLARLDAAVRKINPDVSLVAVNRAEGGRSSTTPVPGAASGGYRGPGLTFPVGEVGQETATTLPAGGVYITSNNKTSTSIPPPSAPTSSAPTRSTTIHIDTINARDDRDVARQIRKVQRDAELLAAV